MRSRTPSWAKILLIPFLLVDPAWAEIVIRPAKTAGIGNAWIETQALFLPDIHWFPTSFNTKATAEISREAGHLSRRQILAGTLAGLLGVARAASPQSSIPGKPAPEVDSPEAIREFIRNLFRDRQNFTTEIDEMFRRKMIPPEIASGPDEVKAAVAAFLEFIQTARIIPREMAPVSLIVSPDEGYFVYDVSYWPRILEGGEFDLFHEAMHFLPAQKKMQDAQLESLRHFRSHRIVPNQKATLIKDPEFRYQAGQLISAKWTTELQAYYLELALITLRAETSTSLREFLLDRMRTEAARRGVSAEQVLDGQVRMEGPPSYVLDSNFSYWLISKYFHPGEVTKDFTYIIFLTNIVRLPGMIYLYLMADTPQLEQAILKENRMTPITDQEQTALSDWAHENFLYNPPPKPSTLRIPGSISLSHLVIAGGLLGLAGLAYRRFLLAKSKQKKVTPQRIQRSKKSGKKIREGSTFVALSTMGLALSPQPIRLLVAIGFIWWWHHLWTDMISAKSLRTAA